jgi:hypothetical protein
MSTLSLISLLMSGLLLVIAFACQIYVSSRVFREEGTSHVMRGILRGTRTFIRGWRRADELEIKDIMIFWSIVVGLLLFLILVLLVTFAASGPPGSS